MSNQTPPDATNTHVVRVDSPSATPEDIAVVVALLSAAGGATRGAEAPPRSQWAGRNRSSWRSSASPR